MTSSSNQNYSLNNGFPKGPKGHWLLGCLKEKWKNPEHFFLENRRLYRDITSFRLGPIRIFQLNSPSLIREHFHNKSTTCIRGKGFEKLHPVLGEGIFTAEAETWQRDRKHLNPFFLKSEVSTYEDDIREIGFNLSNQIQCDTRVSIKRLCAQASLQVVFKNLFQIPWQDKFLKINQLTETIKNCVQHQIHSFSSHLQWLPTSNNRIFWKLSKNLRQLSEEIIEIGRVESLEGSLLYEMIKLCESKEISEKHLIDQITTIAVTGHETVTNTLCWALELLALHSRVQKQFCHAALNKNELKNKEFIETVVLETIRLFPAAWIISHEAIKEHHLGGWKIPKKSLIFVVPYTLHRDPELWENPEDFIPERFLKTDGRKKLNPYQYVPFGGGARHCLGSNLATLEVQILLEELLKTHSVHSNKSEVTPPEFSMTIRPKSDIYLEFRRREDIKVLKSSPHC